MLLFFAIYFFFFFFLIKILWLVNLVAKELELEMTKYLGLMMELVKSFGTMANANMAIIGELVTSLV